MSDFDSLRNLRRQLVDAADSSGGDSFIVLKLAFTELRLAIVSGNDDWNDLAARAFQGVAEDQPDAPHAWIGLGMAELSRAAGPMSSFALNRTLGGSPETGIADNFLKSMGPDSGYTGGIIELGQRALGKGIESDEAVALVAFRTMPIMAERDLAVGLIRARLEREAGSKDTSIAVIDRVVARHPTSVAALRLQAIIHFATGRIDGVDPWYDALAQAGREELVMFRNDLAGIVPDSVLESLVRMPGERREPAMRAHWSTYDPDGLASGEERLLEHYRRLDFARHNYVRRSLREIGQLDLDTVGYAQLDARGQILLRHGSPVVRTSLGVHDGPEVEARIHAIGVPPNETWSYDVPGQSSRLYHFVANLETGDMESVESALDILRRSNQFRLFRSDVLAAESDTGLGAVQTYGAEYVSMIAQELLQSLRSASPIYTDMLNQGKGGADSLQAREREIGRTALAVPGTYELDFELPLDADVDLLAIGSDRDGPVVQVAFAIPGRELTPRRIGSRFAYQVRLRLALLDDAGQAVTTVDTLRTFLAARSLGPNDMLLGHLPVRVPPGSYRIRAAIETEGRGALTPRAVVNVAAPTGQGLSLSDLALGSRSVPVAWVGLGRDSVWTNPTHRFERDVPMTIHFEVGGLAPAEEYRVAMMIDRGTSNGGECEGRGSALTVGFTQRHPGGVDRVHRDLRLERLGKGNYVVTVSVTSESGTIRTRCRSFSVVE